MEVQFFHCLVAFYAISFTSTAELSYNELHGTEDHLLVLNSNSL